MTDLYKLASRLKFRFPTSKGEITVEQLWSLPLTSATQPSLDTVAKTINGTLQQVSENSFVSTTTNPEKPVLEAKLDIVKDVIATKITENQAAQDKVKKAQERNRLLDAIANKEGKVLEEASLDELKRKLAALEEA
jgi:hypothetical protein